VEIKADTKLGGVKEESTRNKEVERKVSFEIACWHLSYAQRLLQEYTPNYISEKTARHEKKVDTLENKDCRKYMLIVLV